jgi:hypothetical protein
MADIPGGFNRIILFFHHMRLTLALILALLVAGCTRHGYDYKSVYVEYEVAGGIVPEDQFYKRYTVNGTEVTFSRGYLNGTVSYVRTQNISKADYEGLGKTVVDSGLFGMNGNFTKADAGDPEKPTATITVVIDGKNKTMVFEPYVEEFMPGNVQKVIFEIRRLAQG